MLTVIANINYRDLSKKELLQKLSKTWTDPMSCAEGDKKEVMKQMMPLVWEGGVSKKNKR